MASREYIICAAVWWNDGVERNGLPINIKTGLVFAGWRHGNCFQGAKAQIKEISEWSRFPHVSGFLSSYGKFYDRAEAYRVALDAGQVESRRQYHKELLVYMGLREDTPPQLSSEDLY